MWFINSSMNEITYHLQEEDEDLSAIVSFLARRFAVSDYRSVYDGFTDFLRSNYMLDVSFGFQRYDAERNMFYYPVTLAGSYEEQQAVVFVKLFYDEYGFHSPRPKDIRGISENSDLEKKLAGIFG